MEKIFFVLLFLAPCFLGSQALVTDSSSYELVTYPDTSYNYFLSILKEYEDGSSRHKRTLIGDTTSLELKLFNDQRKREEKLTGAYQAVLEMRKMGESGKLLKTFSGDSYYSHASDKLGHAFFGDYTLKLADTTYAATISRPNNKVELQYDTSTFILLIQDKKRFKIKDWFADGDHLEVFRINPESGKRVYVDLDGIIRFVFIESQ